jgi:hypothetical protein
MAEANKCLIYYQPGMRRRALEKKVHFSKGLKVAEAKKKRQNN